MNGPFPHYLTKDQAEALDKCIKAEVTKLGFNEFGDPAETTYPGGTPLKTDDGKSVLYREYVAVRHPELVKKCPVK